MKSFDVSALTLSDLDGTVALGSIVTAAELRGVSPEALLAEVAAEPLSIGELTIGLQLRADDIIEECYGAGRVAPCVLSAEV